METFKNAKIGDKVWDVLAGWGKIEKIGAPTWSIIAFFPGRGRFYYTAEGKRSSNDINPSIFPSSVEGKEITFKVASGKEKVKKYLVLYKNQRGAYCVSFKYYKVTEFKPGEVFEESCACLINGTDRGTFVDIIKHSEIEAYE